MSSVNSQIDNLASIFRPMSPAPPPAEEAAPAYTPTLNLIETPGPTQFAIRPAPPPTNPTGRRSWDQRDPIPQAQRRGEANAVPLADGLSAQFKSWYDLHHNKKVEAFRVYGSKDNGDSILIGDYKTLRLLHHKDMMSLFLNMRKRNPEVIIFRAFKMVYSGSDFSVGEHPFIEQEMSSLGEHVDRESTAELIKTISDTVRQPQNAPTTTADPVRDAGAILDLAAKMVKKDESASNSANSATTSAMEAMSSMMMMMFQQSLQSQKPPAPPATDPVVIALLERISNQPTPMPVMPMEAPKSSFDKLLDLAIPALLPMLPEIWARATAVKPGPDLDSIRRELREDARQEATRLEATHRFQLEMMQKSNDAINAGLKERLDEAREGGGSSLMDHLNELRDLQKSIKSLDPQNVEKSETSEIIKGVLGAVSTLLPMAASALTPSPAPRKAKMLQPPQATAPALNGYEEYPQEKRYAPPLQETQEIFDLSKAIETAVLDGVEEDVLVAFRALFSAKTKEKPELLMPSGTAIANEDKIAFCEIVFNIFNPLVHSKTMDKQLARRAYKIVERNFELIRWMAFEEHPLLRSLMRAGVAAEPFDPRVVDEDESSTASMADSDEDEDEDDADSDEDDADSDEDEAEEDDEDEAETDEGGNLGAKGDEDE